jgi:hypothetical protein
MSDTEDNVRGSRESARGSFVDGSSEDESSEIVANGDVTDSSSTDNHGVTNRVNGDHADTDSEEEAEEIEASVNHQDSSNGFSQSGEPQFQPKKVEADSSDSSDTEEDEPEQEGESEDEIAVEKVDSHDGCTPSKGVYEVQENNEGAIRTPSPIERTPSPGIEYNQDEKEAIRTPSPVERTPSPEMETPKSPTMELNRSRSPTPERKDSRGSEGSSSYDERASSLSPEPPKVILAPSSSSKLSSPTSPPPSSHKSGGSPITKIYTEALVDSDGEESFEKVARHKPATDITQIYTAKLVEKEVESNSPKMERAFKGKAQGVDITQLYTAAFNKDDNSPSRNGDPVKPRRNENITKLYTGVFSKGQENGFKAKPTDEFTHPKKHNMSTAVDKEAIRDVYNEVMADNNGVEWAAFTFDGPKLGVTAKGNDFENFKTHFGPDDRGFGYVKIMTGDEMSKRSKFVFCTWVGPNVSVMKKAKMSTDKALLKEIIQNLSIELQIENANEFSFDHFKSEVDKAGGARYGTGVRDM